MLDEEIISSQQYIAISSLYCCSLQKHEGTVGEDFVTKRRLGCKENG
jgi:hypothetical protein